MFTPSATSSQLQPYAHADSHTNGHQQPQPQSQPHPLLTHPTTTTSVTKESASARSDLSPLSAVAAAAGLSNGDEPGWAGGGVNGVDSIPRLSIEERLAAIRDASRVLEGVREDWKFVWDGEVAGGNDDGNGEDGRSYGSGSGGESDVLEGMVLPRQRRGRSRRERGNRLNGQGPIYDGVVGDWVEGEVLWRSREYDSDWFKEDLVPVNAPCFESRVEVMGGFEREEGWVSGRRSGAGATTSTAIMTTTSTPSTSPPPTLQTHRSHLQSFLSLSPPPSTRPPPLDPSPITNPYRFESPDHIFPIINHTSQHPTSPPRPPSTSQRQPHPSKLLSHTLSFATNPSLRYWHARRNAWTSAIATSHSPSPSPSHPNSELIPLPPSRFTSNPLSTLITPQNYRAIYNQVVVQGRKPNVPINLKDMTKAIVLGWQEGGEWPPKGEVPERSFAKKRGGVKRIPGGGGGAGGVEGGKGMGQGAARKLLMELNGDGGGGRQDGRAAGGGGGLRSGVASIRGNL